MNGLIEISGTAFIRKGTCSTYYYVEDRSQL
jgi:hypothetical protein